jgi:DNA-binding transcriptional LysR family regulator
MGTGPLIFNERELMLQAALDGLDIAYILEEQAEPHIAAGRVVQLLEDWSAPFPGYFLYHPSGRRWPL